MGGQAMMTRGVIEILDREGQVRAVFKLALPEGESAALRIGRSPACDVVLDDSHLAGEHAELRLTEHGLALTLLASLNGGWVAEKRLMAGDSAALGAEALFQLGATHLRWRSVDAPLAPEVPLAQHQHRAVPRSLWWGPGLILLWLALTSLDRWLGSDPGGKLIDYAWPLLGPLAAVLAWSAVWALVTQLFQHRFPFGKHLRRVVVWLCVMEVLDYLLPGLAYAFSVPRLAALPELIMPVAATFLIWWHAALVWPRARRSMAIAMGLLLALGLGLRMAQRTDEQYAFGPRYLSALPPPALRMVKPVPPEKLLQEMRDMRGALDKMAKKDSDTPAASEEED